MESVLSHVGAGLCYGITPLKGLGESKRGVLGSRFNSCSFGVGGFDGKRAKRMVLVKAEAVSINPDIRKSEDKVVDSVVVTELSKPLTAYCRCWRSGTFPLCDGSHVKHNKATGDNVGPLLLKK
ncbi:CDGSH iron-sulfur domain-containing protein NEET [Gastrolobium bilobum]|uniref:CDGSH iron-sulfur domain-containing protein NEET n=1 Tax=Gastrolobium bilobum TaxID=150636 RepID=UPI002AB29B66|nr:CDGSH iron-sulfur domain-containing protein NEET [Gastrolobium bilobum]